MLGLARHIGSHVQQNGVSGQGRYDRGQPRTVHTFHDPDDHLGNGHHGPGVSGADKAARDAVSNQLRPHADRRVSLLAERRNRLFVHRDCLACVANLDGQTRCPPFFQHRSEHRFPAHQ